MTDVQVSSPGRLRTQSEVAMEASERAKEREFYRYYHQSQRPKPDPLEVLQASSDNASQKSSSTLSDRPTPTPSDDKILTALAQLGALRLKVRRCVISFFDRKNSYILAEATQTLSLETGATQLKDDQLAWGVCSFPRELSLCHRLVTLPLKRGVTTKSDYKLLPTLVVNDLSKDPKTKNFASVTGPPYSRFYAGVPIRSPNGHRIGSYCILDDTPRDHGLSSVEMDFLRDMAISVMRHLETIRAADDYRLGGLMVRSLGTFAEGKSTLQDWHEPWEPEEPTSPIATVDTSDMPPQRRPTLSNLQSPQPRPGDQKTLDDGKDSFDSSNITAKNTVPASAERSSSADPVITPASDNTDPQFPQTATKTASSTKIQTSLSPEVKGTFHRAANIVLEATEADGAVFFDAKLNAFGGLVDKEVVQEPLAISPTQDMNCAVLGAALRKDFSHIPIARRRLESMPESVLRHLLRSYPHGQIFNLDDESTPDLRESLTQGMGSGPPTPSAELLTIALSKRSDIARSQDDENLLREIFPDARSLVLYPIWDSHRDRWFAGAIIWSSEPMRVFTSEQELSYMAAFSNSVMAEVARLDTKLADRAKGDFISSISHELRSPLHGILGCCELLRDTQVDTFQSSMAQTIETCGKTLLDTINHVLDYAKINNLTKNSKRHRKRVQGSKHIISPAQGHMNDIMTLTSDVDLSVLTEEVLETVFAGYNFQQTATHDLEKHPINPDTPPIAVIVDINKSDNYVFRTQPGAWRRVLMNLFGNALKYTPAGFIKVKLQVTRNTSSLDTSEVADLRMTITDSGIGMSQDYVNNRLFHSFAQENPLSQGTGLGLSIVKLIVESLGGDIEVRSEQGHGTKFTVTCPLKPSILSPGVLVPEAESDLANVVKRTEGMKVSFTGFDEEDEYFPVKSLKNKNATLLNMKALDSLCTDWFKMDVQRDGCSQAITPDLIVATEAGAKRLRALANQSPTALASPGTPVIVVCQGAASAHSTTAITVPSRIFECIPQPCGPHKMAKALMSCLNRHTDRLKVWSTESDSSLPVIQTLSLQENLLPIQPLPHKALNNVVDLHRPPIKNALSAPELPATPASSRKIIEKPARALHCLAVDDNPINLRLLRTFIGKLHHTHNLASNGLEALRTFKEVNTHDSPSRFDVVLMDINMPEMDGLESTRQIRAYEREVGLPPATIIALTGVASSEAQQEAHVSGVNLFLIKPVRLAELEVVLKGVITAENKDAAIAFLNA